MTHPWRIVRVYTLLLAIVATLITGALLPAFVAGLFAADMAHRFAVRVARHAVYRAHVAVWRFHRTMAARVTLSTAPAVTAPVSPSYIVTVRRLMAAATQ